ncbi:hypothetical protein ACV07N_12300 [Roseivirga echinicomitans]
MKMNLNKSYATQLIQQGRSLKFNLVLLAIMVMFLQACGTDDVDPTIVASQNLTFTKVMEPSKYAEADGITVSPNEKYMIFSFQEENTDYKNYYSKDGGLTAHELPVYKHGLINSDITNDGFFVFSERLYDLNNVAPNSAAFSNRGGTAVTASGKLVYINHVYNQGKTFQIYENGAFVDTGVKLLMDQSHYVGVSGEKLAFFDYYTKTIAEFDVTTKTYTETKLTNVDYNKIPGTGLRRSQIKMAYSEGYFAYAKDGGCLIISPSREVTYYSYPTEYQNYLNTVDIKLYGDRAYLKVTTTGGVHAVLEAKDGNITKTNLQFPFSRAGNNIYSQGFIENGDRLTSGIIKETSSGKAYLPLSFKEELYNKKLFAVNNYIYVGDKVYNQSAKTFATSPIGTFHSVYYDTDKTFAYTSTGTYTTTDGINWIERSKNQPRPTLITKNSAGVYYGLGIAPYTYFIPGTGFSSVKFNQKAYTSSNGVDWNLIPGSEKNALGSGGPSFMSSTGVVIYVENITPQSNPVWVTHVSENYGVNYKQFRFEELPEGFRSSMHETRKGKFVSVEFALSGEMTVWVCETAKGGCTSTVSTPTFNSEGLYAGGGISNYTAKDEIIFSTPEGVYISSSF